MKNKIGIAIAGTYFLFLIISKGVSFSPGIEIGKNFIQFFLHLVRIVPCLFVILGLFDVWVEKEKIERKMGQKSGIMGFILAILLASTTVGGIYLAFPVAYSLWEKGARLAVIFTYVGAAGVCRVLMTFFEASFLGMKFSLIRILISLPLVVLTALLIERQVKKEQYKIEGMIDI